jgi:hypothetical protein
MSLHTSVKYRVSCDECDYEIENFTDDRDWAECFAKLEQWYHNSPLYRHCPGKLSVTEVL